MEFNDGQQQQLSCRRHGYVEESEEILSDLTDCENGEEEEEESTSVVDHLPVLSSSGRCLKRRHKGGVFGDSTSIAAVVPERRSRRRIHEQFALLRAVVPDSSCSGEKASILTATYEYIEKLQRLEAELRCELDMDSYGDMDVSCCEDVELGPSSSREGVDSGAAGSESSSSSSSCSQQHSQFTVEVVRTEQGLKMHVECETRPGLLLEMMEMLESRGLTMEEANIECVDQRLVFHGIGTSEVEAGSESAEETGEIAVSAEVVRELLRSLISGQIQRPGSSHQDF